MLVWYGVFYFTCESECTGDHPVDSFSVLMCNLREFAVSVQVFCSVLFIRFQPSPFGCSWLGVGVCPALVVVQTSQTFHVVMPHWSRLCCYCSSWVGKVEHSAIIVFWCWPFTVPKGHSGSNCCCSPIFDWSVHMRRFCMLTLSQIQLPHRMGSWLG